jgi:excisionase family DNA binding protein
MSGRILHPRSEAAHLLAISVRKLDQLVREQAIRIVKIGRRTLVPHAELERFARFNIAENLDGASHGE